MGFPTLVWRSLRLRCPVCGEGRLFAGWFRMHASCSHCNATFEREAGFFLGSIYFNYGLTALIVAIAYPTLLFSRTASENQLLLGAFAFTLLFPVWFFRYARALWLGFDQFMDPRNRRDTQVDLPAGVPTRGDSPPQSSDSDSIDRGDASEKTSHSPPA
jgi:uncharacterized protein (DUF983 family)